MDLEEVIELVDSYEELKAAAPRHRNPLRNCAETRVSAWFLPISQAFHRVFILEVEDPQRFLERLARRGGAAAKRLVLAQLQVILPPLLPQGIAWSQVKSSLFGRFHVDFKGF